ncbi:MAG: DNA polymerase III subunit delta [Inquilinaceae bacterium]
MTKIAAGRVDGFLRAPDPACRAALIYGPDAGLVRERSAILLRRIVDDPQDPFRVADMDGGDVVRDPARLGDEAASLSLTGGRRVIRVRQAADGVTAALTQALAGPNTDSLIIVEAGDLGPRSSLRKLCEGAKNAVALPCYAADADAVAQLAQSVLRDRNIALDRDAEAVLADRLTGDRQVARQALETLATYVGDGGRADMDAVLACVGDSAERSLDDLVLAVGNGDHATADRLLATLLDQGTAPVAVLRAAQRHFGRLHLAAARVAGGEAPDRAMATLRPPVFFKIQPLFRRQLERWRVERLGEALERLMEAEAGCKRTGAPDRLICGRVLLQLSSLANRAA